MKRLLYIVLLGLLFVSCKKDEEEVYYITANGGQQFEIVGARVLRNSYFPGTTIRNLHLYLYTDGISFNVEETKGNGGVICLNLRVDSTDFKSGTYEVNDNIENFTIVPGNNDDSNISGSFFKYTKSTKVEKDTTYTMVKRGWISISDTDENGHNTIRVRLVDENGDSISGSYTGSHTIINNTDGLKVGEINVGDSIYSLQRGDLMQWGDIWSCGANYYELFFYSTNMRTTESGAFQKGLVMVFGVASTDNNAPLDGTYTLAKGICNGVAWTGRKENSIDWGSYWYNYQSQSAFEKAFINKGSLTITKEDDNEKYNITFNCIDQLGDTIVGQYNSNFKIIDLREEE